MAREERKVAGGVSAPISRGVDDAVPRRSGVCGGGNVYFVDESERLQGENLQAGVDEIGVRDYYEENRG